MKPIVAPVLLGMIAIVGWVIEYLNAQKTKTPRVKLRWSLLILFIIASAWAIYIAYEDAREKSRTDRKIEEIAESMKRLGVDPKKLLEKYPLGYVIFELDYTNKVFPYNNLLLEQYELNWDVVGFTKITSEGYSLRLPDIKAKDGSISLANLVLSGPRKVGEWELGGLIDSLAVWGQIIEIRRDGIVFLVGFEEMKSGIPVMPNQP